MNIAELVLGTIYESLKLLGGELGSKLERELRDIIRRDKEGRIELDEALSKKYPDYNDVDVKLAEKKISEAKVDMEKFKVAYIGLLKPLLEAKK